MNESKQLLQRLTALAKQHNLPKIGCSTVSSAIGESQFDDATPLSAYRRIVDGVKPEANRAMLLGRYFEEGVRNMLADEYGITCFKTQEYVSAPPLHGYIDGRINETTILEIKTTARGYEKIPHEYIIQANLYMLLANAPLCTYAVFTFSNQELDIETIAFDDALTADVLARLSQFYEQHVIPRIPPPATSPKEYRESIKIEEGKVVELDCCEELLRKIHRLKIERDQYEYLLDEAKFELELMLGGAEKATYKGKRVASYSVSTYKTIDTDKLKAKYPDVYNECLKVSGPTLRLNINYNALEKI
jgi:predicted phage-related endonuclease